MPNALTLIHKTTAILPSILSPTPKNPGESLELWNGLLDYAHGASVAREDSASDGNRKARIVGAFILPSFILPAAYVLTPTSPLPVQCTERIRTRAHLIS